MTARPNAENALDYLVEYFHLGAATAISQVAAQWGRAFESARVAWRIPDCQQLLREAKRWSQIDTSLRGQVLSSEGLLRQQLGEWTEAERRYRQALECFQSASLVRGIARTLNNLALLDLEMDNLDRAAEHAHASLQLAREQEDTDTIARALGNLGIVHRRRELWDEAIACFEESKALFEQLGDTHSTGQALTNLGNLYRARGQPEQALGCYEGDLRICHETGDRHGAAQALNNLGLIQYELRQWTAAVDSYQASLVLFQELGDTDNQRLVLNNLGMVYDDLEYWDQAMIAYEGALDLCRARGQAHELAQLLNNLSITCRKAGQWERAAACLEESRSLRQKLQDRKGEAIVLVNMCGLAYARAFAEGLTAENVIGVLHLAQEAWQAAEQTNFDEGRMKVALFCANLSTTQPALVSQVPDYLAAAAQAAARIGPMAVSDVQQHTERIAQRWVAQGRTAEAQALLDRLQAI